MRSPDNLPGLLRRVGTTVALLVPIALGVREAENNAYARALDTTRIPVTSFYSEANMVVCLDAALKGGTPDGKCGSSGDVPLPGVPIDLELTRGAGNIRVQRTAVTDENGESAEVFSGTYDPSKEDVTISAQLSKKLVIPIQGGVIAACMTEYTQSPTEEIDGNTKVSKMNGQVIYEVSPTGDCGPETNLQ